MKKQLKNVCFAAGIALMTTCLTFPSQLMAQESARTERHELPNAERSAKQLTDKMQHELGLTDKQYKKIYNLNLKEQKKIIELLKERPQRNFPHEEGGRPQGPRPPMGGPQGEFGRPGKRPDMKGPHPAGNQELEKLREKNEKKLKKILTEEQYAKWKKIQPQKPPKDFSRK